MSTTSKTSAPNNIAQIEHQRSVSPVIISRDMMNQRLDVFKSNDTHELDDFSKGSSLLQISKEQSKEQEKNRKNSLGLNTNRIFGPRSKTICHNQRFADK